MDTLTLPVLVFISIPEAVLVGYLGLQIFGIRPGFKQLLFLGTGQAVLSSLIRSLPLAFGWHIFLQYFSFTLIMYIIMSIRYRLCLLAALFGLLVYTCIEAITVPFLLNLSGLSISTILSDGRLRFIFFLPEAILMGLCIFLIHKYDLRIKMDRLTAANDNRFFYKYTYLVWLFLIQTFLISIFYFLYYVDGMDYARIRSIGRTVFPLIILALPVFAIVALKKMARYGQEEMNTKAQLDSLKYVEELLYSIRAQRHNFCHELQVVYGLLEVGAFQDAKDYLKKGMAETSKTSELVKTDNLGITALLWTKSALAESHNVSLEVYVTTSLEKLPMETRNATIILGNLIENALEAVRNLPAEKRNVEVSLSQDFRGYFFSVKNPGPRIPPDMIGKMFNPDFSTKGEGRGIGLYSAKKLAEKNKGSITVESRDGSTCFTVMIPHR